MKKHVFILPAFVLLLAVPAFAQFEGEGGNPPVDASPTTTFSVDSTDGSKFYFITTLADQKPDSSIFIQADQKYFRTIDDLGEFLLSAQAALLRDSLHAEKMLLEKKAWKAQVDSLCSVYIKSDLGDWALLNAGAPNLSPKAPAFFLQKFVGRRRRKKQNPQKSR
jgi:hypothetical protein